MIALDMETCYSITRLTLTEYRDYLQSELDKWNANPKDDENPDGYWLHPEDVVGNMQRIKRMNKVLEDFGGELYGEREAGESDEESSVVEASKGLEAYFLEIRKTGAQKGD
jgi:hypothetical protein